MLNDAYTQQQDMSSFVHIMACRLFDSRSSPELMLAYCQYSVGCNYLFLPEIPASGTKVSDKYNTNRSTKFSYLDIFYIHLLVNLSPVQLFPWDLIAGMISFMALRLTKQYDWWLWCQKGISPAGTINCIPQYSVSCNYLSLPEIPASDAKVFKGYAVESAG